MMFLTREDIIGLSLLPLSRRRPLSYRNQSIGLLCNSLDWFLYDNGLRHERVNITFDQSDCVLVFVNIQTKTCPFADEFRRNLVVMSMKNSTCEFSKNLNFHIYLLGQKVAPSSPEQFYENREAFIVNIKKYFFCSSVFAL